MIPTNPVNSINEYLNIIKKVIGEFSPKNPKNKPLFYRGAPITYESWKIHNSNNNNWLLPKVWRYEYDEREVLLDYKQYLPQITPQFEFPKDIVKILADMQHYGMPTRLLDWTTSPLVALFFACSDQNSATKDENGMVYILNPWEYYPKEKGKKCSSIQDVYVHARALLSFYHRDERYSEIKNIIKKQYDYELDEEDIKFPHPYISSICNDRIVHQKGCFTIHGTDKNAFTAEGKDHDWKLITICNKKEILKDLDILGIDDYSIFPDFEGMKNTFKRKKGLFRSLDFPIDTDDKKKLK